MGKAYVYYSYEEYGRGYIGARNRSPVDDTYFGTFSDTTFNPTEKIVLAEFENFEEALAAEVELHAYFEVNINPHFANKAKQTSSGFYFDGTGTRWSTESRRNHMSVFSTPEWKEKISEVTRGDKNGFFGRNHSRETREKISKANRGRSIPKSDETKAKMSESAKSRWETTSPEKRSEIAKKGHKNRKRLDRMWITNGDDNRYVSRTAEVPKGWRKGRTRKW